MNNETKKKFTEEELVKLFELIAKAYAAAGKPISYATVYSDDDTDGTILVPTDDKNLPEFED